MKKILLNGKERESSAMTIEELLGACGIDPSSPGVAVALNDRVVRRAAWTETAIDDGDRVEIITAMQGG
jgi:sulfur carrier protein